MVEAAMNDPTALEALDLTVYTRHLADRGDLTAEKVQGAGMDPVCCSTVSALSTRSLRIRRACKLAQQLRWCNAHYSAHQAECAGRHFKANCWHSTSEGRLHAHFVAGTVKGQSVWQLTCPPADAQGLSQSVMVDLRMELLAPYAELRPERDPPRVRSPIFVRKIINSCACWRRI